MARKDASIDDNKKDLAEAYDKHVTTTAEKFNMKKEDLIRQAKLPFYHAHESWMVKNSDHLNSSMLWPNEEYEHDQKVLLSTNMINNIYVTRDVILAAIRKVDYVNEYLSKVKFKITTESMDSFFQSLSKTFRKTEDYFIAEEKKKKEKALENEKSLKK